MAIFCEWCSTVETGRRRADSSTSQSGCRVRGVCSMFCPLPPLWHTMAWAKDDCRVRYVSNAHVACSVPFDWCLHKSEGGGRKQGESAPELRYPFPHQSRSPLPEPPRRPHCSPLLLLIQPMSKQRYSDWRWVLLLGFVLYAPYTSAGVRLHGLTPVVLSTGESHGDAGQTHRHCTVLYSPLMMVCQPLPYGGGGGTRKGRETTPAAQPPVRQLLGFAKTTPAGTPAAAANRTQRPDAAREGKNG